MRPAPRLSLPPGWPGRRGCGQSRHCCQGAGLMLGAQSLEQGCRHRHGLQAAILPKPLQEEGLVSKGWLRVGGTCQHRGWGGTSPSLLSAAPPLLPSPCPAALHGPGWCWHRGVCIIPPADGGTSRCHTCPPGEKHLSYPQSPHWGGEEMPSPISNPYVSGHLHVPSRDSQAAQCPMQGARVLQHSGHHSPHPATGGRGVICWEASWQGLALSSSHAALCLSFPF